MRSVNRWREGDQRREPQFRVHASAVQRVTSPPVPSASPDPSALSRRLPPCTLALNESIAVDSLALDAPDPPSGVHARSSRVGFADWAVGNGRTHKN